MNGKEPDLMKALTEDTRLEIGLLVGNIMTVCKCDLYMYVSPVVISFPQSG